MNESEFKELCKQELAYIKSYAAQLEALSAQDFETPRLKIHRAFELLQDAIVESTERKPR